jgi:hypothetical protein
MKKICIILLYIISYIYNIPSSSAQTNDNQALLKDSLITLGFTMYNEVNEAERLQANYSFIKKLVQLLKTSHSFNMNLDSLKMISIQQPADNSFKIFSWHIKLDDGSFRYYGTIQINTKDGQLKLYPIVDQSPNIKDPDHEILGNGRWYGCQYYDIIPIKNEKNQYLLLGWKGTNPEITQKVIDILQLSDTGAFFGKAIFTGKGVDNKASRMIYRFNARASMLLKYEKAKNNIIMDHLAPSDPKLKGEFKYYGPDMSYDAWEIKDGQLVLLEDLPLKNEQ